MNHRNRSLSLAAFTAVALAACSSFRATTSGTMIATGDRPVELRVQVPEAGQLTVEVWSQGPDDARFELVQPDTDEMAKGVLTASGTPFRWSATTTLVEVTITAPDRAIIGYRVRCDHRMSVSAGRR